ncbi:hypothetical protein [Flagellimonas sp.]|jgi:hypothetical protein|uniref:hypothetical protein n=1 Tax=Flagellimonas sp. TaxID=2058762 RepID=UPI003BA8FF6D
MKNKIGLIILILLLGYGIIRIGVGTVLLAQASEIISFEELNDATLEVEKFINARSSKQLVPFTTSGYFAYILVMGILLTAGAVGIIARGKWGFYLLWIYIAMHAALFVNYQEINPKIIVLAIQIILLVVLTYLRPAKRLN